MHQAAVLRRVDALFRALSTDFLLREQFITDPAHDWGITLAQDEASSVIYGMPREAALLGAAERVLPLDQIGAGLATLCGVPSDSISGALR